MFGNRKNAIGIDFGTHFIKIVSLIYDENNVKFDKYIIQKTPVHLINNGVIQQTEDLGTITRSLLNELQLKPKHISFSIPVGEDSALIKWVEAPNLKPKELGKAVESMLEDEFRHPPQELYYNWLKLSNVSKDGKDIANIMVVGVLKNIMDNTLETLKFAKVKPYYAEADIFSTIRSLFPKQRGNKKLNVSIVDIGANKTLIAFIKDGELSYIRNIPIGGYELLSRISNYQGLDAKSAEEQLFTHGAISSNPKELSFEQQVICDCISEPLEMILEEIKMTNDFYQEHYHAVIDKMIFVGGASRIKGIEKFSSDFLNVPCEIGIPEFANKIEHSKREELEKVWPSLTVALGLALKEVENNV